MPGKPMFYRAVPANLNGNDYESWSAWIITLLEGRDVAHCLNANSRPLQKAGETSPSAELMDWDLQNALAVNFIMLHLTPQIQAEFEGYMLASELWYDLRLRYGSNEASDARLLMRHFESQMRIKNGINADLVIVPGESNESFDWRRVRSVKNYFSSDWFWNREGLRRLIGSVSVTLSNMDADLQAIVKAMGEGSAGAEVISQMIAPKRVRRTARMSVRKVPEPFVLDADP